MEEDEEAARERDIELANDTACAIIVMIAIIGAILGAIVVNILFNWISNI